MSNLESREFLTMKLGLMTKRALSTKDKKLSLRIDEGEIEAAFKQGFQLMQILDLISMSFDAAVVFVTNHSLLFRLALAILCSNLNK